MVARTLKNLLREELRVMHAQQPQPSSFLSKQAIVDLLNKASGADASSHNFWAKTLRPGLVQRFGAYSSASSSPSAAQAHHLPLPHQADQDRKGQRLRARVQASLHEIILYMLHASGLSLTPGAAEHFHKQVRARTRACMLGCEDLLVCIRVYVC